MKLGRSELGVWTCGSGARQYRELGYMRDGEYVPIMRFTTTFALLGIALSFTAGVWFGLAVAVTAG